MKKIIVSAAFLTVSLIALTGCSSNNPKAVAQKFLNGVMHLKLEDAKAVSDSTTRNLLEIAESRVGDSLKAYAKDIKVTIKDVHEAGDSASVVFTTSVMNGKTENLHLVKRNGQWLVSIGKNEPMPLQDEHPDPEEVMGMNQTAPLDDTTLITPSPTAPDSIKRK
jgi:hypothetical protein